MATDARQLGPGGALALADAEKQIEYLTAEVAHLRTQLADRDHVIAGLEAQLAAHEAGHG